MSSSLYSYHLATPEDAPEVKKFLIENFVKHEPMSKATKMTNEDFLPVLEDCVKRSLESPFSTFVKEMASGQIVGVMTQSVWKRPVEKESEKEAFAFASRAERPVDAIGLILNDLHSSFWDLVPSHINTVLHREMSSVHEDHMRKGIANNMFDFSIDKEKLKKFGIDGVASEASSNANQHLLMKRGFVCLREILFRDVIDTSGKPFIQDIEGTTKVQLLWKPFN